MRMHMGIDIEAPPETVWTYLIEPEKAMSWYTMLTVFNWTNEERVPARPSTGKRRFAGRLTGTTSAPPSGFRIGCSPGR